MADQFIEKIVIKPSTELTADEYEHFREETANIVVHTFTSNNADDEQSAFLFRETLKQFGYKINDENAHCLDTDNFFELQKRIHDDSKDSGGLILFISGVSNHEGTIRVFDGHEVTTIPLQEVVTKFTSYTCLGLKNKPKIFIFHTKESSTIQTDGVRREYSYDLTYDTPGEADMLIVYKKTERIPMDFVTQLCDKIEAYGKEEDIVSLVTHLSIANDDSRPLLISTLTKKFFFTDSEYRGHHYHIHKNHKELNDQLEVIKSKLQAKVKNSIPKKQVLSKNVTNSATGARKKENGSNLSGSTSRSVLVNGFKSPTKKFEGIVNGFKKPAKKSEGIPKRPVSTVESDFNSANQNVNSTRTTSLQNFRLGLSQSNRTTNVGSRTKISSTKCDGKPTDLDNKPRWR